MSTLRARCIRWVTHLGRSVAAASRKRRAQVAAPGDRRAAGKGGDGRRTRTRCSRNGWPRRGSASRTTRPRWRSRPPTAEGRPSVRMVLMKGHDARGFVFYTNLDSRKGGELAANPRGRLAVPLEVASPPGPDRRAGRAGERSGGGRLFRHPIPRFPARRLGVGPVAAARHRAPSSRRATRR